MEKAFINNSNYNTLRLDILHGKRIASHALDNWGNMMSDELRETIRALYEAHEAVLKQMEAERG